MEAIPVLPWCSLSLFLLASTVMGCIFLQQHNIPGYQFGGGVSTNGIGGLLISESLLGGIFSRPAVPFFAS